VKKLILLSLLFIGSLTIATDVEAQTVMTNPNGLAIDTAVDATAEGATLQVKGFQSTLSIVTGLNKLTGTISGSILWQGSNDGTKWATLSSDTLTNATNVYKYSEAPKKYLYYKATIAGSGTGTASYSSVLYTTKQ
jgi:hypothetical protein